MGNTSKSCRDLECPFGKAKQINILGSRQHPAEKVALWCEFFFLSAVKSRGIPMLTNIYLMVYEQYKFHLSIVCDM